MVKKVDGPKSKRTSPLQSTARPSPIGGTRKSETVREVAKSAKSESTVRVQQRAGRITEENKQMLLRMVEEEANKLFNKKMTSEKRRKAVEAAVKMVIEGSPTDEE